ncbi:M29 family metallopeptidase [Hymenobacter elongatus]|uniref:Aminopeptidase n=1 Tax=Hymenobacter elongatus TaxID=877208 RepID=A0A4Z0PIA2_9BACT|nr:hypothetical protein [Hymenobacter elongatus]TGE15019.1 hypothetical protein E5J99_14020 [Hymenobacter elongatus]
METKVVNFEAVKTGIANLFGDYMEGSTDKKMFCIFPSTHDNIDLIDLIIEKGSTHYKDFNYIDNSCSFEAISNIVSQYDNIIYFENSESTHSKELSKYLDKNPKDVFKFTRIFDWSFELFEQAFNAKRETIRRINESVIYKGWNSSVCSVKSNSGTDLEIALSQQYGWINSYGLTMGGHPSILPPSEAATYSDKINGILVGDGAINTNFKFDYDPRLGEYPIKIEFKDSQVVNFECPNYFIQSFLKQYFSIGNANRVGEVGFGTNVGLKYFVDFQSHLNERWPSLHLGLGAPNQGERIDWGSVYHLDIITNDTVIIFDNDIILQNNSYKVIEGNINLDGIPMGYADTL